MLCPDIEELRGRTDITDAELEDFVNRTKATDVEQKKNIFHQRVEDSECSKGDPSKFRNHKYVYGRFDFQNGKEKYKPCELIIRKNGTWLDDCRFCWDKTWSFESDPTVGFTHNLGGNDWTHTMLDILPWILLGSTPQEATRDQMMKRMRTVLPFP